MAPDSLSIKVSQGEIIPSGLEPPVLAPACAKAGSCGEERLACALDSVPSLPSLDSPWAEGHPNWGMGFVIRGWGPSSTFFQVPVLGLSLSGLS